MTEKERNLKLYLLLQDLIVKEKRGHLQLLATMIEKDTPSMQKTFELMTKNYKHLLQ